MMILICSTDTLLVEIFTTLPLGDVELRHTADISKIDEFNSHDVDLFFIDLKCCDENAIPALNLPAMALAEEPNYDQGMRLLRRGIRGYGNRYMHRENLVQAVSAVKDGQVWLPPTMITRMISSLSADHFEVELPKLIEPLSRREEEVAGFVMKGLTNREIAENMHISVRTVKAHLTSVFAKTGFRDRLELAVRMKRG